MLNYSSHAITDLLPHIQAAERQGRLRDAEQIAKFVRDVRLAEKFVLPDHGSLIYDMASVPDGIEITRLPFPVTVMEVPFPWKEQQAPGIISASKRLILAREGVFLREGIRFRSILGDETPNAVKIDVACWIDMDRTWMLQPLGAILMIGSKSFGRKDPKTAGRADIFRNTAMFEMMTEPTLDDTIDIICERISYQEFVDRSGDDVANEIRMLAEMMTVLSCANVTSEVEKPPEKLLKARGRSGKEPHYDVHVLTVDGERLGRPPVSVKGVSEDGFQVRQHVRRGHVRLLQDGRRTWINRTVVAAGSRLGVADKIYEVA